MIKHSSYIELTKSSLKNNLDFIKSNLKDNVKITFVVKGNAYGHGVEQIIPIAEHYGIDHFSTFSADEAYRVSKVCSDSSTIMIMGWISDDDLFWAIENEIEFYVFEVRRLEKTIEKAKQRGKPAKIHLEVETGMNRSGFKQIDLPIVAGLINDNKNLLEIKGLCTHYAGAETIANHVRVLHQHKKFLRLNRWFKEKGIYPEKLHTASSAATITYPKFQLDMVRVGILIYGLWPSQETLIHHLSRKQNKVNPLKRIISWKSTVMSIKYVKEGEFIGYGTTFLAHEDMRIAVIPIGYAHGYSRALSNSGRVLIKGSRLSVIRIVNMNMIIVDITGFPEIEIDDEVVLIGTQGEHTISIATFGEISNQLNYELLSRLPLDIPRHVIDE